MDLVENKHIQGITDILINIGERVEGNLICDIYPTNWTIHDNIDKLKNLQYLCKNKKKIIEIGVNACHSLLLMLIVNPDAEYLLFDLNRHAYTEPTLNYIKSQFPNTKFDVFFGDSVQTIDKFILDNPDQLNSYDLIHLDGGHSPEVYTEDFNNSRHLITNDGIVIFDDSHHDNIRELINTNIKDNIISEFIDSNITITPFHFIFKFIF